MQELILGKRTVTVLKVAEFSAEISSEYHTNTGLHSKERI
jgi:hypothetical protein